MLVSNLPAETSPPPPAEVRPLAAGRVWRLSDVIQFDFSALSAAQTHLASAVKRFQILRRTMLENPSSAPPSMSIGDVPKCLAFIRDTADSLGLGATKAGAERGAATYRTAAKYGEFHPDALAALIPAIEYVLQVLSDETDARLFFAMEPSEANYYTPSSPAFGMEVDAKFPKLSEDIECAGKCIAVGQPTAAVFHLMRAMEGAVQVLAGRLGVANTEKEWGKLLSDIHKAIEAMPLGDSRNAWSAAHANLYHVKQAWRNDTMHPKQSYSVEQAKEIFAATKTFMVHLAGLV